MSMTFFGLRLSILNGKSTFLRPGLVHETKEHRTPLLLCISTATLPRLPVLRLLLNFR